MFGRSNVLPCLSQSKFISADALLRHRGNAQWPKNILDFKMYNSRKILTNVSNFTILLDKTPTFYMAVETKLKVNCLKSLTYWRNKK